MAEYTPHVMMKSLQWYQVNVGWLSWGSGSGDVYGLCCDHLTVLTVAVLGRARGGLPPVFSQAPTFQEPIAESTVTGSAN